MNTNEMKRCFRPCKSKGKPSTTLLRCTYESMGFLEVDHKLVVGALDEILKKTAYVQAGLDEYTKSEKLLFILLCAHCENH